MEPAKKLREGFEPPAVGSEPPGINYWIGKSNYFEALYLRARMEIANANKGIRRLQRIVEARDKVIALLEAEIERSRPA